MAALIAPAAISSVASADTIAPLGMGNRAIGGGDLNAATPGVYQGQGLNNVGLLIRSWGVVTFVDSSSDYFYIDDGSGMMDYYTEGIGVRVYYGGLATGNSITPPLAGQIVAVTGISCLIGDNGFYFRQIRPRRQSDISLVRDVLVP